MKNSKILIIMGINFVLVCVMYAWSNFPIIYETCSFFFYHIDSLKRLVKISFMILENKKNMCQ